MRDDKENIVVCSLTETQIRLLVPLVDMALIGLENHDEVMFVSIKLQMLKLAQYLMGIIDAINDCQERTNAIDHN